MVLRCLFGTCWVTQEGDARDYVIGPRAPFLVTRAGHVLVQALTPTRLEIVRPG